MKKVSFLFLLLIGSVFFLTSATNALGAASLSLSPTTYEASIGATINAQVKLNTGGEAVTGVDGVVTFDPKILEVSGFTYGVLFSGVQPNPTIDNTNGKLVFHPGVSSASYAFTGEGLLATVIFSAKGAGTSSVSFSCTDNITQNDSNVWSAGKDIISCSASTGAVYSITSGGGLLISTITPAPTVVNTIITPTPDELMGAGITKWTFLLFILGVIFLAGGIRILLAKRI